jgi:acetoin utilization deacetylase AcuC-like enzyme
MMAMTLLYYDLRFLEHDTGDHPECAERIRDIPQRLHTAGLDQQCRRPDWEPLSGQRLARVHSPEYTQRLRRFAEAGGGYIEGDTALSRASYDVALLAAGAACDAVERILAGEDRQAFCLLRPPGHHALGEAAMGFCLLNNVAIAAKTATEEAGLDRVLIVDWDVHHGNGTQAIFWEDPRVGFLSIHRWPFYPGTGLADETGGGRGLGTTLNLPVAFGTPRGEYTRRFCDSLDHFAAQIKPQLVLISAGFDAHRRDPVGNLGLEVEDFAALTRAVLDVADGYAQGRLVSVLEGGYDPEILGQSVEAHLGEMLWRQRMGGDEGRFAQTV